MEFSRDNSTWEVCTGDVTGLTAGDYYVRIKEGRNHHAGAAATVTVPEFGRYTIKFNPCGGTVSPISAVTDEHGKLATMPTPTRSGSYG